MPRDENYKRTIYFGHTTNQYERTLLENMRSHKLSMNEHASLLGLSSGAVHQMLHRLRGRFGRDAFTKNRRSMGVSFHPDRIQKMK